MRYEPQHALYGVRSAKLLAADATNRAVRSLIQAVVAAFLVGTNLFDVSTLRAVGISALTGGVMAVLSYVMRRWGDPSVLPTPLPPAPAAAPADPEPITDATTPG